MGGRKKACCRAAAEIRSSVFCRIRSASATLSADTVSSRQNAREKGVGNRCPTRESAMDVWALAGQ